MAGRHENKEQISRIRNVACRTPHDLIQFICANLSYALTSTTKHVDEKLAPQVQNRSELIHILRVYLGA